MSNEETASASFCANLRLALSYDASVSEASRQLGISRQQLTRYLSGASFPSRSNMRVICDHVGCDEYEMLLTDSAVNVALATARRGVRAARVIRRTVRISDLGQELWEAAK